MTVLCLSAQDLKAIFFGVWKDGVLARERTAEVPPEEYLHAVDSGLKEWGVRLTEFNAILVVSGPGSFTSSRISVVIANTIAFARQIPVLGRENSDGLPLSKFVKVLDSVAWPSVGELATPVYNRPPHITFSSAPNSLTP